MEAAGTRPGRPLLRKHPARRGRRAEEGRAQAANEGTRKRAGRKRPTRAGRKRTRLPDTRKTWKRRARARGVHCSGNTRPDEDVGRVGPRQLDAATSQAPMEEEPDWSCDNQSEDGCLPSHAPRSHTPRSLCSATTLAQGLGFDSRWWGPSHSNLSHGAVPPRGFSRGFCPGFFFPRLLPRGSSQQQHQLQIKKQGRSQGFFPRLLPRVFSRGFFLGVLPNSNESHKTFQIFPKF